MLRKIRILILLVVLVPSFVIAQLEAHSNTGGTESNLQTDALYRNYNIDFRNKFMDSQKNTSSKEFNSVYLFEDWDNTLVLKTLAGRELKVNSSNFNIKTDTFEISAESDSIYIMQASAIKEIRINDLEFLFVSKGGSKYYQQVYKGSKIKLLKRYGYKLKKAAINPMTKEKVGKDEIKLISSYYLMQNDEVIPIQLKKKSIIMVFHKQKSEIIKFAKERNISFKDENDIVKIIQFTESI